MLAVQVAAHRGDQAHGAAEIVRPGESPLGREVGEDRELDAREEAFRVQLRGLAPAHRRGGRPPSDHGVDGGGALDPLGGGVRDLLDPAAGLQGPVPVLDARAQGAQLQRLARLLLTGDGIGILDRVHRGHPERLGAEPPALLLPEAPVAPGANERADFGGREGVDGARDELDGSRREGRQTKSSGNLFGIQVEALRNSRKNDEASPKAVLEIGDRLGFSDRGGLRRGGLPIGCK